MITWLAGISSRAWLVALGAVLALLAASLLITYTRGVTIKGLEADLTVERANVVVEQGKVRSLQGLLEIWKAKVAEQNAAIERLKAEGIARAQESARLLARARAQAVTAELKVKELQAKLDAPTPEGADARQAVLEVRNQLDKEGGL